MKSNMNPMYRKFGESILLDIMYGKTKVDIDKKIIEFKKSLDSVPIKSIAKPTGVKNINKYIASKPSSGQIFSKLEILPTTSGNILKALIENNVQVGVSSRGMGSLKEINEGTLEVQDDFELLCWDFVSTPSNPGSYMQLVKEGKEIQPYQYNKVNSIF